MTAKEPLNQILYGPPGTGKTYNTIYKALDILEPKDNGESWSEDDSKDGRIKALDRLKELKSEGRIMMTTFHQSLGYEDFIEGIKPKADNGKVSYEPEPGIFRKLCANALSNKSSNFDEAYNKLVDDISDCNDDDPLPIDVKIKRKTSFGIYPNSRNSLTLLTGKPLKPQGSLTKERLEMFAKGEFKEYWVSYYQGVINLLSDKYGLKISDRKDNKAFILIIDEINRGNVANIFGELITLIEDDKRTTQWDEEKGVYVENPEGVKVKLPYSGDEFGVPGNLYIIGTMNTADRSVEALDSALRRRFSFTEMMPKPELLKYNGKYVEIKDTGHTLANLLYTINKRIEVLKDREHQIGHSYFMQFCKKASVEPKELKDVFYNKIIPLLQEYFYGDYEKIRMVLSPDFVVKEEKKVAELFKNIDKSSNSEIDIEAPYQLKEIDITDEVINNMHLVNQYPISQSPKAEQL